MAAKFSIEIKSPCEEKWASMDPFEKGRFCQLCQKEVIDFSNLTDKELIAFFQKNRKEKVCGRFQKTQLKTYHTGNRKQKGFLKLALAGFTLLSIFKPTEAFSQGHPIVKVGERETGPTPVAQREAPKKNNSNNFILISGVVKEAGTEETLPGVNIQLKGSNIGTVSNLDGKFELRVTRPKETVTLLINFVGYETKEIMVKVDEREIYKLEDSLLQLDVRVLGDVHYVKSSIFRRLWWRIKSIF